MKKVVIILCGLAILNLGCSKSDDSDQDNPTTINPPEWIMGTWLLEDPNPTSGFRFSDNDFCLVLLTGQNCFRESIRLTGESGAMANVSEVITENGYSIEITQISQVVTYQFQRLSDTEIELVNDPLGDLTQTIYVKQ